MKSEFLKVLSILGLVLFFAIIVFTIVFWQLIKIKAQEVPQVIITEIMYDLDGSDTNREWVEIYNRSSQAVTIVGGSGAGSWRFNDGSNHTLTLVQGDLILEPQEAAIVASDAQTFLSEHSSFSGTVIDTVMNLNNSGDIVALSSDGGQTFFTQVNYLSSWGAAGNGKTLEKIDLNGDDSQNNWRESNVLGGTPGTVTQSNPEPPVNPPVVNQPPIAEAGPNQTVQVNQSVIFDASGSSDPDGNQLTYNWHLGDGNLAQGVLVNHIYSIAGTYIVILEVSDGLAFATDTLEVLVENSQSIPTSTAPIQEPETNPAPLENHAPIAEAGDDQQVLINEVVNFDATNSYDQDGNQLTYHWDFGDGTTASGATTTHQYSQAESYSVTLIVSDGQLEDQDIILIEVSENIPASGPSISNSGGSSNINQQSYSNKIIINEILPNPKGPDEEGEFIELFNQGYETVDLADWQLQDNSSRIYTIKESDFTSTAITPGGYFVITRKISGISLNNSGGDKVILYQPTGNILQVVEYTSSALEGKSYARKENGEWIWTVEVTAGKANIFGKNLPPKAIITLKGVEFYIDEPIDFDGSLSTDPDNGSLTYNWDFGDGKIGDEAKESHIYETTGTYNVILTVIDEGGLIDKTTQRLKIKIPAPANFSSVNNLVDNSFTLSSNAAAAIIINEFLPNPVGSDESEWIELYNPTDQPVDLSGLLLDDGEGSSAPYSLKGYSIKPFGYLIINRADSHLALNNSLDSVRLLSLNGQNIQEINYSGAKEGKSYSYNQILGNWFWSDTPTPGLENQSPLVNNQQIAGLFSKEPEQKFYQISELKELEKGTKIITQGIVTVLPGILGKKVFYVAEVDLVKKKAFASPGLEVYSSISEFPKLTIGDVVEFSGKVSEVQGKKRINLQKDSQINIIDHWKLPAPEVMATGETSEDLVGSLVSISGILLEKKGSNYFLDDGSGEIKIFFKNSTNIKNPTVKVGETLEVSGILDLTSAGFRLLPPSSDDVRIGKVLGETVMADEEIKINSDNQRKGVKKYLLWGGGGTLVLLIVALLKNGFRQR